ncbi:type I phosphomannose isomerase catalytic subunit [Spongiivirga citrea]|uniref:Phosphohexomutase n=1 Tax=Spongiivirga citrea TaxID=1481457 RepID=A0A6M0CI59_9FLAO|nr:type I phosphomannose isomerase catalytic subunit [Spongiivirga citrea]NER16643.1 mannose-6-phosphate isomerase [Spongiivirga citrea]
MKLYPLKFEPIFKYRMWGGNKLETVLNKSISESNIGESWEISAVSGDENKVSQGFLKGKTLPELIEGYKEALLGETVYKRFGGEFPLLIKFIDTAKPLSVQLHPNDDYAKKYHDSFGKNEMWYIMQADDDAEIIVGFDKKSDKESFAASLKDKSIIELLNSEKTKKGDVFHIPTGRIHAIGAGVLLAEIQQTSDVTYRVYDYDRVDTQTGTKRELHIDKAIDVIDFQIEENGYKTAYPSHENESNELIHTPYFKTSFIPLRGSLNKDYSNTDSFVIFICVEGTSELSCQGDSFQLNKGETLLLPACINHITLKGDSADILEVTV